MNNNIRSIEGEGFTGFVHYFTRKRGTKYIKNYISVEGPHDPRWSDATVLLDHTIVCNFSQCNFVTPGSQEEAYVKFSFIYSPIYLTAYTLRTRTDNASEAFPTS